MPGGVVHVGGRQSVAALCAAVAAISLASNAARAQDPLAPGDPRPPDPLAPAEPRPPDSLAPGEAGGEGRGEGAPDAPPTFTARARLEWLTAAGTAAPRDTPVNPDNRVLLLPAAVASSELRPDLRVEYGTQLLAVARPRLLLETQKPYVGGSWQPERSDARAEWIDLYASWRFDDRLAVAYGLQNFQWGPAELASPSNRIFHQTGFTRDPLYLVRGKDLARVNVSVGRSWSAVLLVEVELNGEDPFVAGEPFEPKAEAKVEWSSPHGTALAGLTAGAGRHTRGFFGEYGSLSLTDGLSVYVDAAHQVGSRAWYPVDLGPAGAAFAQDRTDAGLRTLALGGVRYTFQGGTDLRLEYLFDEAGWTEAQLALASRAAATTPEAVGAWLSPGFEFVGRQHAYASLTIPDLPPAKKIILHVRYLAALEDGSGAAFATASLDATDSTVVFVSAMGTHGSDHGALSRLARGTAVLGAVVSW